MKSLIPSGDPDRDFRNLDDEDEFKWLVLDSPKSEELFTKHYLDLELAPFEVFTLKLERGRFYSEEEVYRFIEDNDLQFIFDTGDFRLAPEYFEKPNVVILWPAGFGKTTITRVRGIIEACDNPNARGQYIFKNLGEGGSMSKSIRQALMSPKLRQDFGEFYTGDKAVAWRDEKFSIAQRQYSDIRDNFEFYGANSDDELGKRCDYGVADDIETTDTARTLDAIAKLKEWLQTGFLTAPTPLWRRDKQRRVMVPKSIKWSHTARYWGVTVKGTIFHPRGVLAWLAANPSFTYLRFNCWKDRKKTTSLADFMMTADELHAKRKELTPLVFGKRYENIAFDPAEMAFQDSWLRGGEEDVAGITVEHKGCLDPKYTYRQTRIPVFETIGGQDVQTDVLDLDLYMGFDPASGSKTRFAAFSAYCVVGTREIEGLRHVWLVDWLKIQTDFSRMLDHLLMGNPEYGIDGFLAKYPKLKAITVEKNAFGQWMVDNDQTRKYAGSLIHPHYTGLNKVDPESGVFGMASMVQNGLLHIPDRLDGDKTKSAEFIHDMLLYPKGTNDLVMAFWLAQVPIAKSQTWESWQRGPRRADPRAWRGRTIYNPAYFK